MPVYHNKGDALRADKIAASARKIDTVIVKHRTGKHKGQFVTLRDNIYCVIEIPLKEYLDKK